jgi:hypothetical protein
MVVPHRSANRFPSTTSLHCITLPRLQVRGKKQVCSDKEVHFTHSLLRQQTTYCTSVAVMDPPSPQSPRMNPLRFTRATTFSEGCDQRRNSTLSDSISEARNSIRSSTDDLFLPRVSKSLALEESNWHSTPLGLALLPAIAGIFFQNGSSFVTDVTLLVLAAIFLNWSVRLPWYVFLFLFPIPSLFYYPSSTSVHLTNYIRDWYRSAQAIRRESGFPDPADQPFDPDSDCDSKHKHDHGHENGHEHEHDRDEPEHANAAQCQAAKELQIHELAALAACFIFPIIGTCLLHGIRSSLSRPSEGLVSNYNLTIFLLASEVRPVAHLLRLIQKRTLHLQRIVTAAPEPAPENTTTSHTITDLTKRLEELESHIAATADPHPNLSVSDSIRSSIQPDIEALNRAVRRYEKRSALFTLQTDQRFVRIEARAKDALALAAAVQRREAARSGYALILLEWVCACFVVPVRVAGAVLGLPGRAVAGGWEALSGLVGWSGRAGSDGKSRSRSKGKVGVSAARQGVRRRSKEEWVVRPREMH